MRLSLLFISKMTDVYGVSVREMADTANALFMHDERYWSNEQI